MSSAVKALELLKYFSTSKPEIGLTELHRLASHDKATTYRRLQALEEAGFVEQNPLTKRYRLGPALLQLGQIRETTVPRKEGVIAPLNELAEKTGETAHVSILSGTTLFSLLAVESKKHSTRAIVDLPTQPLHATASGICAMAFGPNELSIEAKKALTRYTAKTPKSAREIDAVIELTKQTGFGHQDQYLDDEVHGRAAPIFDQTGQLAGTVSVACVTTRFNSTTEQYIKSQLIIASRQISFNWGGNVPEFIEAAWKKSLTHHNETEAAV